MGAPYWKYVSGECWLSSVSTHRGRATHICVISVNNAMIGSDNGSSLIRWRRVVIVSIIQLPQCHQSNSENMDTRDCCNNRNLLETTLNQLLSVKLCTALSLVGWHHTILIAVGEDRGACTPYPRGSPPPFPHPRFSSLPPPPLFPIFFSGTTAQNSDFFAPAPDHLTPAHVSSKAPLSPPL